MIVDIFYNNISKNLRTIDTAAVSKDQCKSDSEYHSTEYDGQEMFSIKFERDFFEISKTNGIYDETDKCFCEEIFAEQKNAGNEKRKKNEQNTERQIITGKFTYDDRDSGSAIINRVIGEQDTGDRETGDKCSDYDCKIRK